MSILAGIDEAGVGPRLGPLVAASATFAGPPHQLAVSLWELLSPAVARNGEGLIIADSKRLYRGRRDEAGFRRLEEGVLGVLAAQGEVPCTLAHLLQRMGGTGSHQEHHCPWYEHESLLLPLVAEGGVIRRQGERLAARLHQLGLEPPRLACEVVVEPAFNHLVDQVGGKGEALLHVDARLLQRVPGGGGWVHLDRIGGRRHYHRWLQKVFPDAFVWVLEEGAAISRYRVVGREGAPLEVSVAVGCEQRQFPVALASMVAKYIRELHMELLNRFWRARLPNLSPTAGYPVDAERFLSEISAQAGAEGWSTADLVRRR